MAVGVPAGLGEPVFDKLKADLAKALFSLPAVLGVEYGVGFGCARLRGSENNDLFRPADADGAAGGRVVTGTNRHGGMLGGISSGMPIVLRAAVKPTSSLPREQATVTTAGEPTTIRTRGRHDPCLLPRFVPMAEAMVAIVLADHWLRWRASSGRAPAEAGRRPATADRRMDCAAAPPGGGRAVRLVLRSGAAPGTVWAPFRGGCTSREWRRYARRGVCGRRTPIERRVRGVLVHAAPANREPQSAKDRHLTILTCTLPRC